MTGRSAIILAAVLAGVGGAAAAEIVQLPPVLVEAKGGRGPRWRLAEAPGYEILSACSDATTLRLAEEVRRHREELGQIVPERFLFHTPEPMTLIVVPRSLLAEQQAPMAEAMTHADASLRGRPISVPPHLRLDDIDSTAMYVAVDDQASAADLEFLSFGPKSRLNIGLAPDYFAYLMQARLPAPPAWLVYGLRGLYAADRFAPREMSFFPQQWLSAAETRRLQEDGDAVRALLPLGELMAGVPGPQRTTGYRAVWEAEAELFVRWAMTACGPDGREKLWKLADAGAKAPMTDADFESIMGLDYASARDALSDYLGQAIRDEVDWRPDAPVRAPAFRIADAAIADVHRIQGEWARRTLRIVAERFPKLLPVYREQALLALESTYDRGGRDPRLEASLGLLWLQMGDQARARALLEQSVAAGGRRPLALLTLAELRLRKARRHPAGPAGSLNEVQARSILGPLETEQAEGPPLADAERLAEEIRSTEIR